MPTLAALLADAIATAQNLQEVLAEAANAKAKADKLANDLANHVDAQPEGGYLDSDSLTISDQPPTS